ncbi:MAG: hypothetical protein FJ280_18525 [Planctomycetes bacterium]|nr:hypothetical protein [Planctomycetota bacterium]
MEYPGKFQIPSTKSEENSKHQAPPGAEAPNAKSQISNKLQIPMTKTTDRAVPVLNLGPLDFGFVWDLAFGAWNLL